MRTALLGALIGAGLVTVANCGPDRVGEAFAQQPTGTYRLESEGLIVVPGPVDADGQMLTVVDTRQRTMAVYHVRSSDQNDAARGKTTLCSVRNMHWDLQMTRLNTAKPLPQEIRAMLEQR